MDLYITFFVCLFVFLILMVPLYFLKKKFISNGHFSHLVIFAVLAEAFVMLFKPVPATYYETVTITALDQCNKNSKSNEVSFRGVRMQRIVMSFPDVTDGKWFWRKGMYCWRKTTDTRLPQGITQSITIKVPVGMYRQLIFSSNGWRGIANISYGDFFQDVDLYSEEGHNTYIDIPDSRIDLLIKNAMCYVAYFTVITLIVLTVVFLIFVFFPSHLKRRAKDYRYEFVFFIFSLMHIIQQSSFPNNTSYPSSFYCIGYEWGFVKRGLIGELISQVSPFIQGRDLANFKLYFLIAFYFLLSILIGRVAKKQNDEKTAWFIIFFTLSLPNISIFISSDVLYDTYVTLILIIVTALILKDICLWLVPLLLSVMLLINETSFIGLLPTVFAMLLYKLIIKDKKKIYAFIIIGSMACTVPLALLFIFRTDPRLPYDIENVIQHIKTHSGFALRDLAISAETWSLKDQIEYISKRTLGVYNAIVIFFCSMIPLLYLLGVIWKYLYRKLIEKNLTITLKEKIFFWMIPLSCLTNCASMFIARDYPRYFSFAINALLCATIFIISEEQIQISYNELRLSAKEKSYNYMPILVCVFYLIYGIFVPTVYSTPIVSKTNNFLTSLFNL